MPTLGFRLVGPLQSWGTQSRFSERDTGMEPSKSGVIGLLCAVLGRPREQPLEDLAALRMGVRVDREGILKRDFQTALEVIKADQKSRDTVISARYYLADACFLVGLEGDSTLLCQLDRALRSPRWSVFLGRKSYVPSETVYLPIRPSGWEGPVDAPGVINLPLEELLCQFPLLTKPSEKLAQLRLVLETTSGTILRDDVPISFTARSFHTRHVATEWLQLAAHSGKVYADELLASPNQEDPPCTSPASS